MDNKKTEMYLQSKIGKHSGWSKYVPPESHTPQMPMPTPMPVPMPTPDPNEDRDDLHMVKNLDTKKSDMNLQAEMGDNLGRSNQASPEPHSPKTYIPPYMPSYMPTPMPIPVPMPTPDSGDKYIPFSARDSLTAQDNYNDTLHMVPGMCYVPMQGFRELYEAEEGFARGTIFAELDYPFLGKGDCHNDRA